MPRFLASLGRALLGFLVFLGGSFLLFADALGYLARGRLGVRETVRQMAVIGGDSLPIVIITLLFGGMVLSLQTVSTFITFGATSLVGGLVALSVTRELAPVLTGVVVAARAGSAIAAELGAMTITEQVDALRALAVSPSQYLVLPRLLAAVIVLPLITIFAVAAGGLGAYLVAVAKGITTGEYVTSIQHYLTWSDLFGGLGKTAIFGGIIAIVGSQRGLTARGGAQGVGQATTSAVVLSIVLIYAANYFLSWLILRIWGTT